MAVTSPTKASGFSTGTDLKKNLEQIFPAHEVEEVVDGIPARFTVYPTQAKQICDLVALARKDSVTLLPIGGATQLYPLPHPMDVAVSLTRLDGPIRHSPHDLTATAPVGLPFSRIQEELAKEGQRLPLDSSRNDGSTLGGVLSVNRPGPLRHRYGSARDWVLGTTVVNGHGKISRAGGQVVKNVSGYDLNKLYMGSRGTLGILLEVSLKLHPLPESRSFVGVRFNRITDLLEAAASFRKSPLTLEGLVVANGNWLGDAPESWSLVTMLAGAKSNIATQENGLIAHLKGLIRDGSMVRRKEARSLWNDINGPRPRKEDSSGVSASVSLGIKGLQSLLKEGSLETDSGPTVRAYPGVGVCTLGFKSGGEISSSEVAKPWIEKVEKLGGFMEFDGTSREFNADRWPILPSSLPWMKKIKKALDPDGVFAPGTFMGGM